MNRVDELIAEIGERLDELKKLIATEQEPAAATVGAPGRGASALSSSALLKQAGVKEVKG